jgi:DNA-binding MarR family transcriptional regulator
MGATVKPDPGSIGSPGGTWKGKKDMRVLLPTNDIEESVGIMDLAGDLPETDHAIAHLLRDAQRSVSRALAGRIAAHGVSIGQWYFLRALWDEDGLTQRELSHRVGMMEPTTVTALNGMEKRGFVERVRNVRDRRKMNIYLTEKGRALRDKLLPFEREVNRTAAGGLSDGETARLAGALRQIIVNLTEASQ